MVGIARQLWRKAPAPLKRAIKLRHEISQLNSIPRLTCNSEKLLAASQIDLEGLWRSGGVDARWSESSKKIAACAIPDGTGGANPGDRRAIYYLVDKFNPASILEVGTHIGASTLHIAEALFMSRIKSGMVGSVVSVDISNVNDPVTKPWLEYGTKHSPAEMVENMGFAAFVEFVTDTSLNYMGQSDRKFDFIFLDGDHGARTVYREIPSALAALNDNGLILLHDYFPDLKPLWSNGAVIPGPFLAVKRHIKEGARLAVLPVGGLPWATKLQSNISSLALLVRDDRYTS